MTSTAVRQLLSRRACALTRRPCALSLPLLCRNATASRNLLAASRCLTARRPQHVRQFYSSTTGETTQEAHSASIFDPLDSFQRRHVGPSPHETQKMLDFLKYDSLDSFVRDVVPPNILSSRNLQVSPSNGLSETQLLERLGEIAAKNKKARSYIGCGYAGTKTPAVIARNILECPEWYTSYTPYQPEISQGM
jgi:glycine dehydrogenase